MFEHPIAKIRKLMVPIIRILEGLEIDILSISVHGNKYQMEIKNNQKSIKRELVTAKYIDSLNQTIRDLKQRIYDMEGSR